MDKKIVVKCEVKDYLPLGELEKFQGNLKKLSEKNEKKLRASILKYGFIAPIFIWVDEKGVNHILDGHQRVRTLKGMERGGVEIPDLPVVKIEAENEEEAREKLLHIASQYGTFDRDGVFEFTEDLNLADLEQTIRLASAEYKLETSAEEDDEPEVEFSEELLEEHNFVVLYFDNEVDWHQAETLFGLKTVKDGADKEGFERRGIGRVLNGADAIEKMRRELAR